MGVPVPIVANTMVAYQPRARVAMNPRRIRAAVMTSKHLIRMVTAMALFNVDSCNRAQASCPILVIVGIDEKSYMVRMNRALSLAPRQVQNALTMPELSEQTIGCPYCGEAIGVLIDDSLPEQRYVEDCQVCCRPIVLQVSVGPDGDVSVLARSENE